MSLLANLNARAEVVDHDPPCAPPARHSTIAFEAGNARDCSMQDSTPSLELGGRLSSITIESSIGQDMEPFDKTVVGMYGNQCR